MLHGVLAAASRRLAASAAAATVAAVTAMAIVTAMDGLMGLVVAVLAALAAATALMWAANRMFDLRLEEFKVLLFRLRA
jgi:hypothetical protein